jgi:hypothetical protein
MVAFSVRRARAARHVDDGDIVLERGRRTFATVLFADISGNTWTRQRLRRLAAAAQARMDHRRLIADLEDGDPDKTHARAGDDAWFTATYGGRMFIDGDSVVSRSDLISFTLVDGDLVPRISVVR